MGRISGYMVSAMRISMHHLLMLVMLIANCGYGRAEEPADSAEAAIRQSANTFTEAFKHQDAEAIANLWRPHGIYVDETGEEHQGREEIQKVYQAFFTEHDRPEIELKIDSIRFVTPDVALEQGTAAIVPPPLGGPATSRYSAVHVKQEDGRWLLDSVRDSRVELPSSYNHLAHLEMLVGNWKTEHNGAEIALTGNWNPKKTYLKRHFTVNSQGTQTTSTELIGWDPSTQQVLSWTFSDDGSRNVGHWKALEDGWVVHNQGVTADGVPTTSVDFWAPLLDGALGWRSTHRTAGGEEVEAPNAVVLKKATNGQKD